MKQEPDIRNRKANQAATDAKQRPGFQIRNTGKKYSHFNFHFFNAGLQNSGEFGNTADHHL